jgi:DNA-binding NarL/FixJ family response regulator
MKLRGDVENLETRQAIATAEMRAELERVEKEREILRLQAEQLRREMEFKERELAALALQLAQRNELVANLRKQIASFKKSSGADASDLANALLPQISQIVDAKGQWKVFEEQFQLVHPDFMQKLTERYSDLTPVEVKICSLLRVNLSTKEIANLLYASVRTVEWHRRFIRKKLGLPQETNLAIFLASLR